MMCQGETELVKIVGVKRLVAGAIKRGETSLSEYDSKRVLGAYGVPITRERLVSSVQDAKKVAGKIGYPVVLKCCAHDLLHKTEAGLIAVGLNSAKEVGEAFKLLRQRVGKGYTGAFIVQEMVKGPRELMIGMKRDNQFGPAVMFGLGGIFTEILEDVSFRLAPLSTKDARQMITEIRAEKILGGLRGLPAVDTKLLASAIVGVGKAAAENPEILEIDINPLIVKGNKPIAVDGLIVLATK